MFRYPFPTAGVVFSFLYFLEIPLKVQTTVQNFSDTMSMGRGNELADLKTIDWGINHGERFNKESKEGYKRVKTKEELSSM